ncbi:MAG: hypothetical protein LAT55_12265 [Opitutales bacterium]|nr:hypothetical protein [Opitutales bacterium]
MFSYELIEELKKAKGFKKDKEVIDIMEGMNSGNMSQIKAGKRPLTEEQALFIAREANLCKDWVLVNLAEERAKSEEVKKAWYEIGKKLRKSAVAAMLAVIVAFGGFGENSGAEPSFS